MNRIDKDMQNLEQNSERELTDNLNLNAQSAEANTDKILDTEQEIITLQEELPTDESGEVLALDDARRVKVLSPNALVIKRFVRNRLALIGLGIIVAMFIFSFLGGLISPYGEDEIFSKYAPLRQNYAAVTKNEELRYIVKEGSSFSSVARARFIGALGKEETSFSTQDVEYSYRKAADNIYIISTLQKFADSRKIGDSYRINPVEGEVDAAFATAFGSAMDAGDTSFYYNDTEYQIVPEKVVINIFAPEDVAIASNLVFNVAAENNKAGFELFDLTTEALSANETQVEFNGLSLGLTQADEEIVYTDNASGEVYASLSPYVIQSSRGNEFIPLALKNEFRDAIIAGQTRFEVTDAEGTTEYTIERENNIWNVRAQKDTYVSDTYASPNGEHWLGTDKNGMDVMTRLMYGGRVSLIIGFIVVLISMVLGTILGGISGYFGGWVDNLIMRIVDIFYCIPSMPIIIILGAAMDQMRVPPQQRMIYLMLILGFLGWPSIARTVRGQILSLREQEFMLATEATGLKVRRRIFTHLIPNVMPQLIVLGSMSVGGTIITESTLSFLGLGVKYPFASWGNIINDVTNSHVMQNYWFVWVPAGICILLTVLAFNLIGDGLRDAYDPKMNR